MLSTELRLFPEPPSIFSQSGHCSHVAVCPPGRVHRAMCRTGQRKVCTVISALVLSVPLPSLFVAAISLRRQTGAFECGPRWTNSRAEYRTRHHPLASLVFRYGCPHMRTRTHFTFRVDTWIADGDSIVERVAGVEDN